MDAVQRRHAFALQVRGHRLVGQQHELFDDAVGDVALRGDDGLDGSGVVDDDLGLGQVEIDRAAAAPPPVENLEQRAHPFEHRHQRRIVRPLHRIAIGDDGVDRRVGHPRAAVDDPVVQLVAHYLAATVDLHQARLHEPVDVRVEAAHAGRQLAREHVDGALGEVDRGAAGEAVEVEGAALGHVVGDVGDVHAEPVVAVGQLLDRDRVVEVAGVLAVDGDDLPAAEIAAAGDLARRHGMVAAAGLGDGVGGVGVGNAVLAQHDLGVDARIVETAEDFDDASGRRPGRPGPALDLDRHHVAVGGRQAVGGGDAHVGVEPGVERRHDRAAALEAKLSDHLGAAPLEDLDDPAFAAPIGPGAARPGPTTRSPCMAPARALSGTKTSAVCAVSGQHEREAAGMALQAAGHDVDPVGQREASAADHHQRAVGDQRLELAPERRPLARRDAEASGERARRLGRAAVAANGLEEILLGHDTSGAPGAPPPAYQAGDTSNTCRSPTLVSVGPGRSRSPSAAKNG